jgi:hypothetical protein
MGDKGGLIAKIEAGAAAISFAAEATWWDWPQGSAPFFWNWPEGYQELIRDGLPPRFMGEPPTFTRPQLANKDPTVHVHERNKVVKVRHRGYIRASRERILSLMHFFSVPKVTSIERKPETRRCWTYAWCIMAQAAGSIKFYGLLGSRCLLGTK